LESAHLFFTLIVGDGVCERVQFKFARHNFEGAAQHVQIPGQPDSVGVGLGLEL
jgi:hypothetical protein